MKNDIESKILNEFKNYFNDDAETIIKASGRFELLGNHTDHNHGYCLSSDCLIFTYAAIRKTNNNGISFYSKGYEPITINIDDLDKKEDELKTSKALIKGILCFLIKHNYKIGGFKAYSVSQIPVGCGLSSSASFEILIANIISYLFNNSKIPPLIKAYAGQFSENIYYGKASGLLDQLSIAYKGIKFINFKRKKQPQILTLQTDIFNDLQIALITPGGNHDKLDELYETIPNTMYEIAHKYNHKFLGEFNNKEIHDLLIKNTFNIPKEKLNIARHFFQENRLVKIGRKAILNNDVDTLFALIRKSALSNKSNLKNSQVGNDYNDSLQEVIDFCTNCLTNDIAIKLTGGGYKGSCVALIKHQKYSYLKTLIQAYHPNWKIMLLKDVIKNLDN